MTPAEQQKFDDLTLKVENLESQIKALSNNATIPWDVGEALKLRILGDAGVAAISTKLATSEDQSVNEAGTAPAYNVLKSPDGFLEITITENKYYLPYYL